MRGPFTSSQFRARQLEVVVNEKDSCGPTYAFAHLTAANATADPNAPLVYKLLKPLNNIRTVTVRRSTVLSVGELQIMGYEGALTTEKPKDITDAILSFNKFKVSASSTWLDKKGKPSTEFAPINVFDSKDTTHWLSSTTDPLPMLTVDLGKEYYVSSVNIKPRKDRGSLALMLGITRLSDGQKKVHTTATLFPNTFKALDNMSACRKAHELREAYGVYAAVTSCPWLKGGN